MNYTALTANIQDICENTFTADQLAMFVQQAEQRIYNSVQLASLRKTSNLSTANGVQYVDLPSDFLSFYSLAVVRANGTQGMLLNKDVSFIRECYPAASTTGEPRFYALFGPQTGDETALQIILGPTPNAVLTLEAQYFYYPESIVTAGSTWLGTYFDTALLNGALVEAFKFMRAEPDVLKTHQDLYVQAIALLKNLGDGKQRQDTFRSGQVRVQVN